MTSTAAPPSTPTWHRVSGDKYGRPRQHLALWPLATPQAVVVTLPRTVEASRRYLVNHRSVEVGAGRHLVTQHATLAHAKAAAEATSL